MMFASPKIRCIVLPAVVVVGGVAGVGLGLIAGWHAAGVVAPSPGANGRVEASPRPQASPSATWIDLGRDVCGECCETLIWRAVGNLRGVRDVTARVGESTIVVHHDATACSPTSMLCALAESWPEAALAERRERAPAARQWIRPVQPGR